VDRGRDSGRAVVGLRPTVTGRSPVARGTLSLAARGALRLSVDGAEFAEYAPLEVAVPLTLPDSGAVGRDAHGAGDHEVDVRHVLGSDGRAVRRDARDGGGVVDGRAVGVDIGGFGVDGPDVDEIGGSIRRNGSASRSRGCATYTVFPSLSAARRTGSCGASGLHFSVDADAHASVSVRRSHAASAPAKFGIRSWGGNGNRASPRSSNASQTVSRTACLSMRKRRSGTPSKPRTRPREENVPRHGSVRPVCRLLGIYRRVYISDRC